MVINKDKPRLVLYLFWMLMLLISYACSAPAKAGGDNPPEEDDHHPKISGDRLFYFEEQKDIAVFPLLVELPEEEIDAGYGVLWPEKGRDLYVLLENG